MNPEIIISTPIYMNLTICYSFRKLECNMLYVHNYSNVFAIKCMCFRALLWLRICSHKSNWLVPHASAVFSVFNIAVSLMHVKLSTFPSLKPMSARQFGDAVPPSLKRHASLPTRLLLSPASGLCCAHSFFFLSF